MHSFQGNFLPFCAAPAGTLEVHNMPLKTLFLNPPAFDTFDGGASSRWPATREIESYWYPVWLAYQPAFWRARFCLMLLRIMFQLKRPFRFARITSSGPVHFHGGVEE